MLLIYITDYLIFFVNLKFKKYVQIVFQNKNKNWKKIKYNNPYIRTDNYPEIKVF